MSLDSRDVREGNRIRAAGVRLTSGGGWSVDLGRWYSSDKTEGFDIWLPWRKRSVGISDLAPKSHTATSSAYFIDSFSAGLGQHVGGGYVQSSEDAGANQCQYQLEERVAR